MKKNKSSKTLKQGMRPAAQALSDDDLMDVPGGRIFWHWRVEPSRGSCTGYGVMDAGGMYWLGSDPAAADRFAESCDKSTRMVHVDDLRSGDR